MRFCVKIFASHGICGTFSTFLAERLFNKVYTAIFPQIRHLESIRMAKRFETHNFKLSHVSQMQNFPKSSKSFQSLPVDILLLIVRNLTFSEYKKLRNCCKILASLSPIPQLKVAEFIKSCKSLKMRDPSKLVRLDYSLTKPQIQQAFLFMVRNNLETEFFRFTSSPYFSVLDAKTKALAISACFLPLSYSFRSLPICFFIILSPAMVSVLTPNELTYHLNESLILACQSSNTPSTTISSLVTHPLTNPKYKENSALIKASKSGSLATVKLLLSVLDEIPPKVFYWPCVDGRNDIMELLLNDRRADPGFYNTQSCIKLASKFGNSEAVRLLLLDSRVDPSVDYNCVLRDTAIRGHSEVMKLLLLHPRVLILFIQVNPVDRDNFAIRAASLHGHYNCVQLLMSDPRVL